MAVAKKSKTTKKKTATSAVAKKESTEVSTGVEFDPDLMGASDSIDSEDIKIPKIWLLQQMSELVQDEQCSKGQYINSMDQEVLADKDEDLEVIVFESFKSWREFLEEDVKGKKRSTYVRTIDFKGNEELPFSEDQGDGSMVRRNKVLGFYCLLPKELEDGMAFPYIIDFTKTSTPAGRKLITFFAKMRTLKKPSYAKTFILGRETKKNDDGEFLVKTIKMGRDITVEEKDLAVEWIKTIKVAKERGNIKADDSDLKAEPAESNVTEQDEF